MSGGLKLMAARRADFRLFNKLACSNIGIEHCDRCAYRSASSSGVMSHKCDLPMMRGLAVVAVLLATSARAATIEVDTSGNLPALVAISGKLELGDEDTFPSKTVN